MNYHINKFFNKNECSYIIDFAEKNGTQFSYNPNEVWDCKRIYDSNFKNFILDKFITKYKEKSFDLWFDLNTFDIRDCNISLTKYYEGRWLDLHLDTTSQLTTVIVLSDEFSDGRFILSETKNDIDNCDKFELKIGQSITFDGSKVFHGVMPVNSGVRYALNIWMTNTDFKYYALDNSKKLI